jgi:hypothetical protein
MPSVLRSEKQAGIRPKIAFSLYRIIPVMRSGSLADAGPRDKERRSVAFNFFPQLVQRYDWSCLPGFLMPITARTSLEISDGRKKVM